MVTFFHCQGVLGGELPMHPIPERGLGTVHVLAHYVSLAILNGHAAVMAFFVLSGFVLTLSLRRGPRQVAPAGIAFATARVFRIIPNNAVVVLAAVAIAAAAGAAPQALRPPPWDWSVILANMIVADTSIVPVAWSLAVELLAVPFIAGCYFATRRWGSMPLVLATVAAVMLSFSPGWIGFRPLGRNLFAVLLGMLVAEHGLRLAAGLSRQRAMRYFTAGATLWLLARALLGRWSHWASLVEACVAAGTIALLVAGPNLAAYRLFELRPILWIGEISFSLYMYHVLLLPWLAPSAAAAPFVWLGGWGPLAAVFATWVVTVAATVPIAWLSYAAVERGAIALGRVLTGRVRAAAAAPAALQHKPSY
jgi:peptidoglycan/LPS O-acetylase OafA/YrhL